MKSFLIIIGAIALVVVVRYLMNVSHKMLGNDQEPAAPVQEKSAEKPESQTPKI